MFNHAFTDGNKRTTLTVTARFLSINGFELEASQAEIVSFPLAVENEKWTIEQIGDWLKSHYKKI